MMIPFPLCFHFRPTVRIGRRNQCKNWKPCKPRGTTPHTRAPSGGGRGGRKDVRPWLPPPVLGDSLIELAGARALLAPITEPTVRTHTRYRTRSVSSPHHHLTRGLAWLAPTALRCHAPRRAQHTKRHLSHFQAGWITPLGSQVQFLRVAPCPMLTPAARHLILIMSIDYSLDR